MQGARSSAPAIDNQVMHALSAPPSEDQLGAQETQREDQNQPADSVDHADVLSGGAPALPGQTLDSVGGR
jgi:hypothetical protein